MTANTAMRFGLMICAAKGVVVLMSFFTFALGSPAMGKELDCSGEEEVRLVNLRYARELMKLVRFVPRESSVGVTKRNLPSKLLRNEHEYVLFDGGYPDGFKWCLKNSNEQNRCYNGFYVLTNSCEESANYFFYDRICSSSMTMESIAKCFEITWTEDGVARITWGRNRVHAILAGKLLIVVQGGPEGRDLAEAIFEYSRQQK